MRSVQTTQWTGLSFVWLGLSVLVACGVDSNILQVIGTVSPSCQPGECADQPPVGWEGPVWLWTGEQTLAPPCPDAAPSLVYEGHAGLQTHGTCGTCTCNDLECLLPAGVSVSKGDCGGPLIDVLTPPGWDGSCWSFPPINDSKGAIFWGSSRTECQPAVAQVKKQASFSWDTFAMACSTAGEHDECSALAGDCFPLVPPGFERCVFSASEAMSCPADYPEMRRFHSMVEDRSLCSPCDCLPPETTGCHFFVDMSEGNDCSRRTIGTTVGYNLGGCLLTAAPRQFASMYAEVRRLDPGTCTPQGGEFLGGFEPAQTTTFCCEHGG
ncbi:uncharacterized protein CMC5_057230 [Chondromyces crocatus]|uniref:Uncharacterized protein n=1 Tax=Chondromyces crocatus TaxID=52 RepID=A0A0K1EKW2_CHOCO|nr:uncharacterized protein CMC5_057230 [Chondromyces crocatus]